MSVAGNTQETMDERQPSHACNSHVPLNSTHIMAGQLYNLGTALGIPVSSTVSNLRLMIEGKITEGGCDPRSVQVLLPRSTEDVSISLRDHKGVFLMVDLGSDMEHHYDSELLSDPLLLNPVEDRMGELQAIRLERDALERRSAELTR